MTAGSRFTVATDCSFSFSQSASADVSVDFPEEAVPIRKIVLNRLPPIRSHYKCELNVGVRVRR
jgi:hypothetical protein